MTNELYVKGSNDALVFRANLDGEGGGLGKVVLRELLAYPSGGYLLRPVSGEQFQRSEVFLHAPGGPPYYLYWAGANTVPAVPSPVYPGYRARLIYVGAAGGQPDGSMWVNSEGEPRIVLDGNLWTPCRQPFVNQVAGTTLQIFYNPERTNPLLSVAGSDTYSGYRSFYYGRLRAQQGAAVYTHDFSLSGIAAGYTVTVTGSYSSGVFSGISWSQA